MALKVIIPKDLIADPRALARAVSNGLDGAAAGALVDFKVTTQTWQHQPSFDVTSPAPDRRVVGTDDAIYDYVNAGTRPHLIVAHGTALAFPGHSAPKTRPKVIGSGGGSKGGGTVFVHKVHHPGTKARDFDEAIAEKWQDQLPIIMQRAIDSEL